jgi:transposase
MSPATDSPDLADVRVLGMRTGIAIEVTAAARSRLEAIVADRNSPQKHVWRARIILLTADSVGTNEIERQAGVDKNSVWRWQERFMTEGVDGLLRDKTRRSRIAPLSPEVASTVVARTLEKPPGETTHWTAAAMTFHFTPTSASWLNAVEGFFAILTKRRLKRGVFRSIIDLQAAINRYLAEHNQIPKPFTWTKDPEEIIAAVKRGHQLLDSIH